MRRPILLACVALWSGAAEARDSVQASAPQELAVTLYRDPDRRADQPMQRNWPRGFAMITETRQVTLPAGESTIRFEGVAEGMVAVSAIVTGLPGGTIEKNRNADLLSPAALIDGTLGNRVTITRTNPATGVARSEPAIVRTRADGGVVLETESGFEAVRCSGLPERLTFDRVPEGLSAQPVYSIDTRTPAGGTYTVQLTYLAWGFDWQAHYVATLDDPERASHADGEVRLRLISWLTLLNDNGQSFPDAALQVVAGKLSVTSDYRQLSDPPQARPLRLTCFPIGSTAAGTPVEEYDDSIVVTGMRVSRQELAMAPPPPPPPPPPPAPAAMVAREEALGDLKLYRVPEPITVAAKGLKQVAFLQRDSVTGRLLYQVRCAPTDHADAAAPAELLLTTVNDRAHGLGVALPQGALTLFEPSPRRGALLVGEENLRDYAEGQDVELALGESRQVFALCEQPSRGKALGTPGEWTAQRVLLTNANREPVTLRLVLGPAAGWERRGVRRTRIKDGELVMEVEVPGLARRELAWDVRPVG